MSERLLVGTWPRGSNVEFQQHREALGACLATEAAIQEVDLGGSVLLYRNDAEAAISALSKGSFRSAEMQLCAIRLARTHMKRALLPRARSRTGARRNRRGLARRRGLRGGVRGQTAGAGCKRWALEAGGG